MRKCGRAVKATCARMNCSRLMCVFGEYAGASYNVAHVSHSNNGQRSYFLRNEQHCVPVLTLPFCLESRKHALSTVCTCILDCYRAEKARGGKKLKRNAPHFASATRELPKHLMNTPKMTGKRLTEPSEKVLRDSARPSKTGKQTEPQTSWCFECSV